MTASVSNDSDLIVLVDKDDNAIGLRDKLSCHEGDGILHRAISVFIFNGAGDLLIQQRHPEKTLWGGYWSNSCCTHPFFNESTKDAAERRVREELGLRVELDFVYKFEYHAKWLEDYAEHELCSVFVGKSSDVPEVNKLEVEAWAWWSPDLVGELMKSDSALVTPWFRQEWDELRRSELP